MSQDRRLDKLEGSLTAKQAVILWLDEIRQYRNVYNYVQFLRGQPESAAPITRITGQIEHTVREAMKGQQKEIVQQTVRRAVRDVVFLVKLHLQVNIGVLSDQRAWSLTVAFLAEMQNRLLTEAALRMVLRDRKRLPSRKMQSRDIKSDQKAGEFQLWKNIAETFLGDLYAFLDAVAFISKYYFDGHEILFPDADKCLTDLAKETEILVGMFNDLCIEEEEKSYQIDLEQFRKGIGKKTTGKTALLVDMAKAESLDDLGEREAAIEIAERYL